MLQWLPVEVWQVSLAVELPGAVMPHGTLLIRILKLTTNCRKEVWLEGIGGEGRMEIIHNAMFQ